jgi:hypothetical protein
VYSVDFKDNDFHIGSCDTSVCVVWMKIRKNDGKYNIYKAGKGWHDSLNDK